MGSFFLPVRVTNWAFFAQRPPCLCYEEVFLGEKIEITASSDFCLF